MAKTLPQAVCSVLGLFMFTTLCVGQAAAVQNVSGSAQSQEAPYQVGRALPPLDPGAELMDLTLDEAVAIALEKNLDIQRARLDPEIQRFALRGAQAAFNPTLVTTFGTSSSTTPSTSQLDGGNRTNSDQGTVNVSLQQPLPWFGSRFTTNFNNNRTATDNVFVTRNPSYRSILSMNFTQPLLAGRRIDPQRGAVQTQEILREITDIELRAQTEELSAQVRQSYWNLRFLIDQIEIQRRSLSQAEQLLRDNRVRVELGIMVELDLAQAEAQVAVAQQALLNAEIQWRNQELAFKRLLVGGGDDPVMQHTLNPVDLPSSSPQAVDIEAAVALAMENRPVLQAQRRQQQISNLNLQLARETARPDLNLTASYTLQGVGGDLFQRDQLGGNPVLVRSGGYTDGLRAIREFETPSYNISLNFSYPIGTSTRETSREEARLRVRQAELDLRNQELQVETEVTTAGLSVTNTFLQLEAARRTREAAERNAEAEITRFGVGVTTNFQVVTAQDALTSARLSELQAIINYANAVADFQRLQGVGW
ncbi:MAG: TolC family protein [Gemmatimonadota bacterium]